MFNIRVLREHNFFGNSCMVRIRKKVCRVSLITNQSLVRKNKEILKIIFEPVFFRNFTANNSWGNLSILLNLSQQAKHINPFQANVPILYPLETSENLWFSEVFQGV